MKVLIACEVTGIVRNAFADKGHDAWSCDLLPSLFGTNHLQCDVKEVLFNDWDIVIAHPPCTDLAVSGAMWFKNKDQKPAIEFFMMFTKVKCKWCIENPIGVMSTHFRKPDQIIQPWQFGHGETKATCLWLNGLPVLTPSRIVPGREQRIWKMPPSPDRRQLRSTTYPGIAAAMAEQWG